MSSPLREELQEFLPCPFCGAADREAGLYRYGIGIRCNCGASHNDLATWNARAALAAAPINEHDGITTFDLRITAYEAMESAASEAKWMPPEYTANDWIADVCSWLRNGASVAAAPVQAEPKPRDDLLRANYDLETGGPNPYYKCRQCGYVEVGEVSCLLAHLKDAHDLQPAPVQAELPARIKCEDCDGTGYVGEEHWQSEFQPPERERCPTCCGSGSHAPPSAEVPAEPTQAMIEAGKDERMRCFKIRTPPVLVDEALARIYKAMRSAAPPAGMKR